MRKVKVRKPRGVKKDGTMSEDMCPYCVSLGCDPMSMSSKFRRMVHDRRSASVCVACGSNPCRCKSKLGINHPVFVV